MKAYKGFNADMTCRGFQFEIGKTYEESEAKLCEVGFHACLDPLECYQYYSPGSSVYCEVDIEDNGERVNDSTKVVGKKITIVRQITFAEIAIIHNSLFATNDSPISAPDYSFLSAKNESTLCAGRCSSLSAGRFSALSAGEASSLSVRGASSVYAGDYSSLSARNDSFLSAGDHSSLSASAWSSLSAGNQSNLSAGYGSFLSVGDYSSLSAGNNSVLSAGANSILTVFNGRCKAGMNSVIVIANRGKDGCISDYATGIVDGVHLLPNVWYVNRGGKLVEWDGENK